MSFDFPPIMLPALGVAAYLLIRVPRNLFSDAAERAPSVQVEMGLMAVLFLAGLAAYFALGAHTPMARLAFAIATMTIAALVYADVSFRVMPDLFAVSLAAVAVFSPWRLTGREILIGVLLCGGLLAALAFIWRTLRSGEGLGYGDVKLAAAVGALLGPQIGLVAISISAAVAALIALALRVARRSGGEEPALIPYVAALGLATMAFLGRALL